MNRIAALSVLTVAASFASHGAHAQDDIVIFESGHVRPIALSPSGEVLYAVNTPDNRVEAFHVQGDALVHAGESVVGLEPVALATEGEDRLWVVNHLSDSISVLDVSDPAAPRVIDTLLVGDEPRDVVVAGAEDRRRVFVTTAHRGQNDSRDPELATPGVGRADVWVFDATTHERVSIVSLFADTPRALAVSPDGARVWAAAFHSGNRSTCLTERAVAGDSSSDSLIGDGFRAPGLPEPTANVQGVEGPSTGLIVQFDEDSETWRDDTGRDWTGRLRFDLPDRDVFEIDATADVPEVVSTRASVGTIIFNLVVHPEDGRVYASNLESLNLVRFESVINGHVAESRVSVIDGEDVTPVHLNPHIDYSTPTGPADERDASLAFPLDMVFSPDGARLYVAAFGSSKVGVLDADGAVVGRVEVGGGPSGLAVSPDGARLYVMERFEHAVSVIDTAAGQVVSRSTLRFDPEPEHVREGRPVLYDASRSGHGDSACASCHIFGDFDSLAWDLGDPEGLIESNPLERVDPQQNLGDLQPFHPLKGPMTTQSLRGLADAGPMHWRGDRNGPNSGVSEPDLYDEGQAFLHFRGAFESLLGMGEPIAMDAMESFRDFILEVSYPPNPIAPIDGTLTAAQRRGRDVFLSDGNRFGAGGDGDPCQSCHALPFGTNGKASFELEPQEFKVAHLRNLYQKVGMFGYALPTIAREPAILSETPTPHLGEQIRGFGFLHDGSIPTLFDFFRVPFSPIPPFTFPDEPGRTGSAKVRDLEEFLLAFPTGHAPVVGHQVTLRTPEDAEGTERLDTFIGRAVAGDCDLVVHAVEGGASRGWLLESRDLWLSDRAGESVDTSGLLSLLDGVAVLTATAVPVGSGRRIAIDRDRDGALDGDERDAGTDPADPSSVPGASVSILRGNCNGDGSLDLSDGVFWLLFLFSGGTPPDCLEACDSNADGVDNLSDAIYTLQFLFVGGPPPGAAPLCEDVPSVDCGRSVCP